MRRREELRQFLILALLVCLNAGRPPVRLHGAEPGAGAPLPGGTPAIAASPAKSLSGGDAARVQWVREAVKAPGQSASAAHQAVSLRTLPALGAAAASQHAADPAGIWRPAQLCRGRAPPSLFLL